MKSEPPTPTRAPDNQFRKMQAHLNHIRNSSLLNLWGWGRGGPLLSVTGGRLLVIVAARQRSNPQNLGVRQQRHVPAGSLISCCCFIRLFMYCYCYWTVIVISFIFVGVYLQEVVEGCRGAVQGSRWEGARRISDELMQITDNVHKGHRKGTMGNHQARWVFANRNNDFWKRFRMPNGRHDKLM